MSEASPGQEPMNSSLRAQRVAFGNPDLVRHVSAQLLATAADWAVFVGALVYAYQRDGAGATGLASLSMLVAGLLGALVTGSLVHDAPPGRVRATGLAVMSVGFGVAGLTATVGASTVVVVGAATIGVGAITTVRPSGASLLPAIVRSTRELVVGNLWTGHAQSAGALGGALIATGLLAIGGASTVLVGCAVMAAGATACTVLPRLVDPPGGGDADGRGIGRTIGNVRTLRSRPGVLAVVFVAGAQLFLLGALDIILVVAAEERLGMGDAGPGALVTLVGIGSIAGGAVSTFLIRRDRLAPTLVGGLLLIAALAVAFGLRIGLLSAVVLLPLIGLSRSVVDIVTDVLLHRSAPPEVLASVYAVIEFAGGIGLILGSIVTQVVLAVSGLEASLYGVGTFFVLVVVITRRSLRLADGSADVPVVSMSLIRRIPVFATLPCAELETLSRAAIEVDTEAGDVVVREGEEGDRYYAVMEGEFDITVGDTLVHRAKRGNGFGEVALLASVPRTATVTATSPGRLLAIDRTPFLIAVTGHDTTRQAAWGVVHEHRTGVAGSLGTEQIANGDDRLDWRIIPDVPGPEHR